MNYSCGMRKKGVCKRDLLFSAGFVFVLFVLAFVFRTPRGYSNDDYSIANYLSGALGQEYATPYVPFINILLGWFMFFLYQFIPGPNWFIIWQIVIEYISVVLIQYILINRLREHSSQSLAYTLSSVMIIVFVPSIICRIEFTQTAAIGGMAGGLWILFSWRNDSKCGMAAGVLHSWVSSLFRRNGFLICLPFLAILFVQFCWNYRKNLITAKKQFISLLVATGVFFLIFFGGTSINSAAWSKGAWKEYKDFNSSRAHFKDYPAASYDEIRQELEELGVSRNDYELMNNWQFADPDFITSELLTNMVAIERKAAVATDYKAEIGQYFEKYITSNPLIGMDSLLSLSIALALLLMLIDIRRNGVWALLVVIGVISMELYFKVYVGRYPTWVRASVLFCGISSLILMTGTLRMPKKRILTVAIILPLSIGAFLLGNTVYFQKLGSFEYNQSVFEMYEWIHAQEGSIFFCPTSNTGMPSLMDAYSVFSETKPGITRGTVSLGGWGTNLPARRKAYADEGVTNPMRQIADRNVFLVSNYNIASRLQQYLYEHTGKETSLSLAFVKLGVKIWKVIDSNDLCLESGETNCSITDILCEQNKKHETWDISFRIIDKDLNNTGKNQYIRVSDEEGKERVFFSFTSDEESVASNTVLFRIPFEDMQSGVYSMSYYSESDQRTILRSGEFTLEIRNDEDGEE